MKYYPLTFKPIFKERIWGGRKLQDLFNKDLPTNLPIGESWELTDLPQDKSVIADGPLAGQTLNQVIVADTKGITGSADFPRSFPLMIKLLDAQDVLSVQVHPDQETCFRMGQGDPKTECWYIMAAEPGAHIYKGLKAGVTRDTFSAAITRGTVADLLKKIPVTPGECHFLPAGTAHAIGPGLLIAEIQLPSDTTYRVFDWNRVDASGQGRDLHIEQALESIHFNAAEYPATTVGRLVDCEHFTVDKGHQTTGSQMLLSPGIMKIVVILTGSGTIENASGSPVDFTAGDCLLIPAGYEGVVCFGDETEYLTCLV